MKVCGIKMTHDAAVAMVEDGKLLFSIELEKLNNNPRYCEMTDLRAVEDVLAAHGQRVEDVDRFVVDGWHGTGAHWRGEARLKQKAQGRPIGLEVASYNELTLRESILHSKDFDGGLELGGKSYPYSSYMHVAGHVLGTYCASPFAQRGEPAYVLAWDGGQYPRLYWVDPSRRSVQNKGQLFYFLGTIYPIMGHYFGPYARSAEQLEADRQAQDLEGYFGGYETSGKLMAYIAKGRVIADMLAQLPALYQSELEIANTFEHRFAGKLRERATLHGWADADVLLTMHTFLEKMLVDSRSKKIAKDGVKSPNFCFCGGSALNIKWNSAIRRCGIFKDVWVAPFPNDSGSAIGTACCEMFTRGITALSWSVFSGPLIETGAPVEGWRARKFSLAELARLLHESGEPVVFLNGRAELGPRALGNRSILAAAVSPAMKSLLNKVKRREEFRPVAPICLESHAPAIFDPGTPDPFMLFDHYVRPDWLTRVPAIKHLDDTARLQTVNETDNPAVFELLSAYHQLSGIPLLCNTSANFNGSGFFPDAASAMRWGQVRYVYCLDLLYEKT
ncbi:MAG TPA: carbamoyltransferase N-terminal domain-containing protein [Burkholderiaceae bacterium]|nr:carbamoyltransferase N-terminal domain-containing protein [Burkholderiaceae bacterium]